MDTSSKADRLRAYETVKAYCFDHSLHLTALIAFPPIYENSSEPNSPHSASVISADHSTHPAAKFLPLSFSKDVVWQDSVFREITEPVLIIQEYIMLLKECSGRVIIVSGCSQGRFLGELIYWDQTTSFRRNKQYSNSRMWVQLHPRRCTPISRTYVWLRVGANWDQGIIVGQWAAGNTHFAHTTNFGQAVCTIL